jgi:hypothetical protein
MTGDLPRRGATLAFEDFGIMPLATKGRKLTLAALAEAKRLPLALLRDKLGVHDLPGGGVGIPYHDFDGSEIVVKRRTAQKANEGSFWPTGRPLAAYGSWRIEAARKRGHVYLVEGETDAWTLWHHGLPVLGLPGAGAAKALVSEHLVGLTTIYIVREPDQGGETFVSGVARRLVELGFAGRLYELRMPEGIKDPSALHCKDAKGFKAALQAAVESSVLVPLARPGDDCQHHPASDPESVPEVQAPAWPEPPDPAAYYGLAGDFVQVVGPHTEADPAALLVQLLVAFGSAIDRTAHFVAEGDRHFLNEFAVLVGHTAKARKGSSWGRVRPLVEAVAPEWAAACIKGGLSSGEGLIEAVRDATADPGGERNDPGAADKRLLCLEAEFASVLKRADQRGNTLTAVLRQAFDGGELRTITRNPLKATGAHISLIGHCTIAELQRYLSETESANGFGNRILWLCVKRSKALPDGGNLDPALLVPLQERLRKAVAFARGVGRMERDPKARAAWHEVYESLSEGKPGLVGALLARAEVHVMRLACLYALLDNSRVVRAEHLMAALALWEYVERSVKFIFGDSLGDPLADELLRLLRGAGPAGLTRTDMLHAFGRHRSADRIGRALGLLLEHRLARFEKLQEKETGRPVERWFTVGGRGLNSLNSLSSHREGE